MSALQLFCGVDLRGAASSPGAVNELLMLANARMWLGHFDLPEDDDMRSSGIPFRCGASAALSVEQLEDLIEAPSTSASAIIPPSNTSSGAAKRERGRRAALLDTHGEA